ncbi:MAG: hypothetical protein ACSHXB_02825 [Sulfitobacter sp.]
MAAQRLINTHYQTARPGAQRLWFCSVKIMALLICMVLPDDGFAVPPDPQRPIEVSTCAEAKQRFREALLGSPLISDAEMAEATTLARNWTKRLCGLEGVTEIIIELESKNCNETK